MSFIESKTIVHLEHDDRFRAKQSFVWRANHSLLVDDEILDWAGHLHVVVGNFHDGV